MSSRQNIQVSPWGERCVGQSPALSHREAVNYAECRMRPVCTLMHLSIALCAGPQSSSATSAIKCVPRFLHMVRPRLLWHKAWTRRIISLAYMQTDDLHNHHRETFFFVFARRTCMMHRDDGPCHSLAPCSLPNLSSFLGGETGAAVWAL